MASNLPQVAHLTGNFTSEAPLSPAVREALSAAFEQGWADPKKLNQASGRVRILVDTAKAQIAHRLSTTPERLEILGEPNLAHYIALGAYLKSDTTLITSTIDVGKIRAIARTAPKCVEVGVDYNGEILRDGLRLSQHSLFSLQAVNGETGIAQDLDHWRDSAGHIVVDATRALPGSDYVNGFSATTFESQSFGGPAGLAFIAIRDEKSFRYPLPHIAPIRAPGSYSVPLLVASAIALEESIENISLISDLRNQLARELRQIDGVTVMGAKDEVHSAHVSAVIDEVSSEELLRSLLPQEIAIDAGSACSPEDLTPSHVISSMGYPTTGHIRLTVQSNHIAEDITRAVRIIDETLQQLRR